ncbi:MAG: hypothetical protein HYY31_06360 [Chloroflexi bacterium]|nr:hypothetical protein [Chloroflexota bacterium]
MDARSKESRRGETHEVVWPSGRAVVESVTPGRASSDLRGRTIGELWDWFYRGDEIFGILEEHLEERYLDVKFVNYREFGNIHGPNEAKVVAGIPELLRRHGCDLVISGVGA